MPMRTSPVRTTGRRIRPMARRRVPVAVRANPVAPCVNLDQRHGARAAGHAMRSDRPRIRARIVRCIGESHGPPQSGPAHRRRSPSRHRGPTRSTRRASRFAARRRSSRHRIARALSCFATLRPRLSPNATGADHPRRRAHPALARAIRRCALRGGARAAMACDLRDWLRTGSGTPPCRPGRVLAAVRPQ